MSLLKHITKTGIESLPEALGDGKNIGKKIKAAIYLGLAALIVLLFMGAEAVRALFRKNYGVSGERGARALFVFALFTATSVLAFYAMIIVDDKEIPEWFLFLQGSDMHLITGVLYSALALHVLIKTIRYWIRTAQDKISPFDEGVSILAKYSKFRSWTKRDLFCKAEPLITIAIGFIYGVFDIIGGIPLIFCGLSVWGNELYQSVKGYEIKKDMANMNKHISTRKFFTNVNTDL